MTIEIITDLPIILGKLLEAIISFIAQLFTGVFLIIIMFVLIMSILIYFRFIHKGVLDG